MVAVLDPAITGWPITVTSASLSEDVVAEIAKVFSSEDRRQPTPRNSKICCCLPCRLPA